MASENNFREFILKEADVSLWPMNMLLGADFLTYSSVVGDENLKILSTFNKSAQIHLD